MCSQGITYNSVDNFSIIDFTGAMQYHLFKLHTCPVNVLIDKLCVKAMDRPTELRQTSFNLSDYLFAKLYAG